MTKQRNSEASSESLNRKSPTGRANVVSYRRTGRELRAELRRTTLELEVIRNSPGYQMLERMRSALDAVAPAGSLRRRPIGLMVRGLSYLMNAGPRRFV